ncbi:GFA family protein [Mesorhizobium captivum]|uniref:GFA family protein n=1 Tax=Mesorhizobium captivum TaxID=3072319 RepID=A0ABU4Z1Q4_9HYPH|nr:MULTISPECIES: GFA family protein [unclassified Mesorhizobium]MDX8446805.1 GFA family protein [Mesorhizobium sp. VK3C]MDX8491994.1 GFA family protein [Mesorhizobium sp. VK22B]MDX8504156.1 GFA family protein [Mesorhizobium sp. VK22E]
MTRRRLEFGDGPSMITGGCLCGAVRYESRAEPITARLCWCRFCQYIAAGNAAVSVCFPTAHMKIAGDTRDYESVADSGNRMHRRFCPACGVHLFSEAESRPHLIFVRAGTLDDPSMIRPAATIWTIKAPPWACIDTSLPTFEGQPPPVA